jgi:hypothetical protein
MDDKQPEQSAQETNPVLQNIIDVIGRLGDATAGVIAETAQVPYSTTTPKLRQLEQEGRAERFRVKGQQRWRLVSAATSDTDAPTTDSPTVDRSTVDRPSAGHTADVPSDLATDPDTADPHAQRQGDTDARDGVASSAAVDTALDDVPDAARGHAGATADRHSDLAVPADPPPPVDPVSQSAEPDARPIPDAVSSADRSSTDPADSEAAPPATGRRPKGALRSAILQVLQEHPQTALKVREVCKLVDQASAGSADKKAGDGAVVNALERLARDGVITRHETRPATFQVVV